MEKRKIDENLKANGIVLGNPPKPGGSYVAVNVRSNIAYVAIQFPINDNKFFFLGRLGNEVTTDQGYQAARMAAINVLAQIDKCVGFDKIVGLNHIDIHYQAGEEWDEGPNVANGASDLFLKILGKRGEHTRSIMGVHKLPKNHSVALTATFTIDH